MLAFPTDSWLDLDTSTGSIWLWEAKAVFRFEHSFRDCKERSHFWIKIIDCYFSVAIVSSRRGFKILANDLTNMLSAMSITSFFACSKHISYLPEGSDPRGWMRYEIQWTPHSTRSLGLMTFYCMRPFVIYGMWARNYRITKKGHNSQITVGEFNFLSYIPSCDAWSLCGSAL